VVLIAALALAVAPANAKAASPVLEFVVPGNSFPVGFEANGGEVTAALDGFDTVVHCSGSHGVGEITGPRSTLSNYVFTGCETQEGTEAGQKCKSAGAAEKEIATGMIEADLVYIDQAKHEVGMLLNPHGGIYMEFECGGVPVEASGPFLSPVGPINQEAMSFTATLSRSGATQIPSGYENANGEKLQAIPMGKRGANPPATTGVGLSFAIHTSMPLKIKAVTAAEIEAKQREDEAAAAAAAKKRQEEEAAAAKKRQEEQQAKEERLRRHRLLSKALTQCRKAESKHQRVRCERRAKNKYGGHRGSKKTGSATAGMLLGRRF
jgi:hypothetical protein